MDAFLAMIVPVGSTGGGPPVGPPGVPTHPIYYPPGIWGPTDPRPTHPIAGIPGLPGYEPPRPPLGIWGPPGPWPTPPIFIPEPPGDGPPLIIWGGGNEPFPTPPIVIPLPPIDAHPEHPIVIPDPGEPPLGIWGPLPGFPTPPIVIPPPVTPERPKLIDWKAAWTPTTGWIVVGIPTVPVPTPSKK